MPQHRVAVLGLGYVGLPLAVASALAGHEVVGFDVDRDRIGMLDAGRTGIENVGDVELEKAFASGRLQLTDRPAELAGCDAFVICVPTPLTDRVPDLSMVTAAVDVVASNLVPGDLVVLESTTYPGTTEELVASRIAAATGLAAPRDYHLAFSPERIDPGNPIFGLANTPKVVGGVGPASARAAARFYRSFVDRVHVVSRPREAEMAKLLENTFRHINIALVNELAILCRELGIDLWEAIDAAATKPFGFMPFRPGPGVGGHCIPVDPAYLSWRIRGLGYCFRFVELAEEINHRMPDYVVSRIAEQLDGAARRPLRGASVLVLGVAYKPDVGDLRESPAFPVVRGLITSGARVAWHDPHAAHFEVDGVPLPRILELTPTALAAADLVLIHTDHSCYDWEMVVASARLVFDARNATGRIRSARVSRL